MAKKLWSVLTDDMDTCMYTGSPYIERHHVFGGPNRALSEKYGYIAPLRYDLHPNGANRGSDAGDIDLMLKQQCQRHYEEHHGTREQFIKEFGKSYL